MKRVKLWGSPKGIVKMKQKLIYILIFITIFVGTAHSLSAQTAHRFVVSSSENLALGAYTEAQSYHNEDKTPAHAVDGSTDTFWSSGGPAQHWWHVDLGSLCYIDSIRIMVRGEINPLCYGNPCYDFEIWGANSISQYTMLTEEAESTQSLYTYTNIDKKLQRLEVRFTASNDWAGWVNIVEFEVYGYRLNAPILTVTEVAELPVAMTGIYAHVYDNQIYCFGGNKEIDTVDPEYRVFVYDPSSDIWSIYDTLSFYYASGYSCISSDTVFFTGGIDSEDCWNNDYVFMYIISTKETDTLTGYGDILHSGGAISDEGKFRLLGGHAYNPILDVNLLFDPVSDSWTAQNPLPGVLERHSIARQGSIVHILGGRGLGGDASNIHITYDIESDTFAILGTIPVGVKDASATCIDDYIFIFGGRLTNYSMTDIVQWYDPSINQWHLGPNLSHNVAFTASVTVDGMGYLLGGSVGEPIDNVYRFEITYDCCIGIRGNADGDSEEKLNISDITYLVAYCFGGGPAPECIEEGNPNGDEQGAINITDITYLVAYCFSGGPAPKTCP